MKITHTPYYLNEASIKAVEELYGAKYMGPWCTKTRKGEWNESPVEVFYSPNPDKSKGHSHYFGIWISRRDSIPYITDASTAFSEPITGILVGDDVIVSRCRHDFVSLHGYSIDGGRDYTRIGGDNPQLIEVTVKDDEFIFKPVKPKRKSNAKRNINSDI